jgi:hypothetical protein
MNMYKYGKHLCALPTPQTGHAARAAWRNEYIRQTVLLWLDLRRAASLSQERRSVPSSVLHHDMTPPRRWSVHGIIERRA